MEYTGRVMCVRIHPHTQSTQSIHTQSTYSHTQYKRTEKKTQMHSHTGGARYVHTRTHRQSIVHSFSQAYICNHAHTVHAHKAKYIHTRTHTQSTEHSPTSPEDTTHAYIHTYRTGIQSSAHSYSHMKHMQRTAHVRCRCHPEHSMLAHIQYTQSTAQFMHAHTRHVHILNTNNQTW